MLVRGVFLALATAGQLASGSSFSQASMSMNSTAIRKVITLIEEMKSQAEKEGRQDESSWEKYMCWCKTNEEAKTKAIEDAERQIEHLTSVIEEAAAKESRLKNEISGLTQDIADDRDALATATATRQKENDAFQAEETDLKETRGLLLEAIQVLSKVQLLQKQGQSTSVEVARAQTALIQLQERVKHPDFKNVMKRDLFDVLGSLEDIIPQHGFLPRKSASLVESQGRLLPWEKTEEQIGMEAKPNDLSGAAANAKSYNSRSGRILGLLSEMSDETARDLGESQRDEFNAEVSFQHLRAAKLDEIGVALKQKKRKEADLADTLAQAAAAKQDRRDTNDALDADSTFLTNMLKDCKEEDSEYHKRQEIRGRELVALAETLRILNEDDARDLFAKTVSFVQVSSERTAAQDRQAERAMKKVAAVARKHQNWALASLAVQVRLDSFTKVKAAMDKMLAELQRQQKAEYTKWEECKANLDKTEDDITVGEQTKEDLDAKHKFLSNTIETLESEIAALKQEDSDMQVALKQAGEQRKEQNQLFQTSVMDQRATTNILNKALARLKLFYAPKLLQVRAPEEQANQPGRAVAPPPPKGQDYKAQGNNGGVIQLLMKIIEDSETAAVEIQQDEQHMQSLYAEFVATTTATIKSHRASIEDKSVRLAETKVERSDTEGAQLANDESLAKMNDLLRAYHVECDWLIKYFDVRQQARAEEMDSITDAKAILSGASFGK